MTQQSIRRLVGAAVLAPLALALAAGCAGSPVSPLPGEPNPTTAAPSWPSANSPAQSPRPGPSVSRPASPGSQSSSSPRPPVEPSLPPSCLGPVVYAVNANDSAEQPNGLCMQVGGTFQVRNIFPGARPDPADLATCTYEAGITNCLLRRPGNVTITAGDDKHVRTYQILIIAGR